MVVVVAVIAVAVVVVVEVVILTSVVVVLVAKVLAWAGRAIDILVEVLTIDVRPDVVDAGPIASEFAVPVSYSLDIVLSAVVILMDAFAGVLSANSVDALLDMNVTTIGCGMPASSEGFRC